MKIRANVQAAFSTQRSLLLVSLCIVFYLHVTAGNELVFPLFLNETHSDSPSLDDGERITPVSPSDRGQIEGLTHQKCFCDIQQIWKNGSCHTIGTDVLIPALNDLYPESDVLSNFVLSSVLIHDVECPETMISVIITEGGLFVLRGGELYHEESDLIFSRQDYCFELIEEADVLKPIAHACVMPPKVPFCTNNNGTNQTTVALNISLGNNFLGLEHLEIFHIEEPKCFGDDQRLAIPLAANTDNLSFHFLSEETEILWQPPPPAQSPRVLGSTEYCLSRDENDQSSVDVILCYDDPVIRHQKHCNNSVCVRKCCPQHYIYNSAERQCTLKEEINSSLPLFYHLQNGSYIDAPEDLIMEYSFPWCSPKELYIIDPHSNPSEDFFLLANGSLYITLSKLTMPPSLYCIDYFSDGDSMGRKALSCFLKDPEEKDYCKEVHRILYPVLIVISCVFLAVTLIVYSLIPELHAKLHGKSLLSHVSSLLVAFLCQLIVSWSSKNFNMLGCKIIGKYCI